ncbi:unnamed protein product [Cochlearia groenlandica]
MDPTSTRTPAGTSSRKRKTAVIQNSPRLRQIAPASKRSKTVAAGCSRNTIPRNEENLKANKPPTGKSKPPMPRKGKGLDFPKPPSPLP